MKREKIELIIITPNKTSIPTKDEIVEAFVKMLRMFDPVEQKVCDEK